MPIPVPRKPTSRYEVVQLKATMEEMLDRAGINDGDVEIKGPTQVRDRFHFFTPTVPQTFKFLSFF